MDKRRSMRSSHHRPHRAIQQVTWSTIVASTTLGFMKEGKKMAASELRNIRVAGREVPGSPIQRDGVIKRRHWSVKEVVFWRLLNEPIYIRGVVTFLGVVWGASKI